MFCHYGEPLISRPACTGRLGFVKSVIEPEPRLRVDRCGLIRLRSSQRLSARQGVERTRKSSEVTLMAVQDLSEVCISDAERGADGDASAMGFVHEY
jgi:hypothetical protein